ncbi:hypothetical protein [Accumulibacter sp.]|uniref:DUF6998 domain-containing protein n=1 Tax=Accumulibacter sp. TaxID=2053492 RepID=UPI002609E6EA|nr:hypothetical protein [Accumulibacter sp.]
MQPNSDAIAKVPELVRKLYELVAEFESLFPGRAFTPDGHLVGSIGEMVAAHNYGLTLLGVSSEGHDATAPNGWLVQIKATQSKSVALRSEPQHLVVLLLRRSGEADEIYNGPGALVWGLCGAMQKNGQRPITLTKLRGLMQEVPEAARLPRA